MRKIKHRQKRRRHQLKTHRHNLREMNHRMYLVIERYMRPARLWAIRAAAEEITADWIRAHYPAMALFR